MASTKGVCNCWPSAINFWQQGRLSTIPKHRFLGIVIFLLIEHMLINFIVKYLKLQQKLFARGTARGTGLLTHIAGVLALSLILLLTAGMFIFNMISFTRLYAQYSWNKGNRKH
jgi:hypothetical protein